MTGGSWLRVFLTLIGADARGATREGILVFVVAIIIVAFIVFRLVAAYQPAWAPFLPPVFVALLLLNAIGFGMVVGFLLVEEADSGVRDALAVTPVATSALLLYRCVLAFVGTLIAGVLGVVFTSVVILPVTAWAALLILIALLAPTVALAVPAIARNKVEALVLFRALGAVLMAPVFTLILSDVWYRYAFLASPAGFLVEAYRAFLAGSGAEYLWIAGGGLYAAALLAISIVRFRRIVYRLNR